MGRTSNTFGKGIDVDASTSSLGVLYRERLTPSIFAFLFALFMIASLGIAYAHVYGNPTGWLIFGIGSPLGVIAMVMMSPVIEITETDIRLGNAMLPREFVGEIHTLNDGETKDASGHAAHRDAYIVLRSWMPYSVIVSVTDLEDPHPYWHFSTRRPERVAELLAR